MNLTFRERMSVTFWWVVASGVTAYLFLGIVNTTMVILQ